MTDAHKRDTKKLKLPFYFYLGHEAKNSSTVSSYRGIVVRHPHQHH